MLLKAIITFTNFFLLGISYSGKVAAEHQLLEQLQDYLITHSGIQHLF